MLSQKGSISSQEVRRDHIRGIKPLRIMTEDSKNE